MPCSYVIWSEEHRAWWRPNSAGYTDQLRQAGRYTGVEAATIVHHANIGGRRFNELALPLPPDIDTIIQPKTAR